MVKETAHGKFVIIDECTMLEGINYALANKIRLLTLRQVGVARDEGLVPNRWYDTATILKNYELHNLTRDELKNAERLKLRLLFLGFSASSSDLLGNLNLDSSGSCHDTPSE